LKYIFSVVRKIEIEITEIAGEKKHDSQVTSQDFVQDWQDCQITWTVVLGNVRYPSQACKQVPNLGRKSLLKLQQKLICRKIKIILLKHTFYQVKYDQHLISCQVFLYHWKQQKHKSFKRQERLRIDLPVIQVKQPDTLIYVVSLQSDTLLASHLGTESFVVFFSQENHNFNRTKTLKMYFVWTFYNCLCVCSTRLLPNGGSLLFQNRNKRDILNTTLLTRITAHKQSLTAGSKRKHHI